MIQTADRRRSAASDAEQGRSVARRAFSKRALSWAAVCAAALTVSACGGARNVGGGAPQSQVLETPAVQSGAVAAGAFGERVAVEPGARGVVAMLAPVGDGRSPINAVGRAIANGAQLALNDIGDVGLDLRLYDTGGTAAGAAAAAEAAAADGAAMILGPLLSRSVSSAAPVALSAGLPMIAFSTDAAVAGQNVYLIGFLPSSEISRVVSFAASRGVGNFAALAPQNLEGEVVLQAFRSSVGDVGGRIAAVERYQQTFLEIEGAVRRYSERHKALSETQPVTGILLAEGGQALNALGSYLPFFDVDPRETKFLGVGKWNDPIVLTEPSLRGGWFAGPDPALRAQFDTRYAAAFGAAPHPLASLGYDAMAAVGAMAEEARRANDRFPFNADRITAAAGFVGVNGVFRFRRDGINERGLAILEVGSDGFRVIDPAPTGFSGL